MHVLNWAQKRIQLLRQLAGLDPAIERRADAIEAAWDAVGQETAAAVPPAHAVAAIPPAAAPAPAQITQYVAPQPSRTENTEPVREHADPEPPRPAPAAKSLTSYLE